MRLYLYPRIVDRLQLSKDFIALTKNLFEAFSMRSVQYQRKADD
jgi:hypothetical protein